MALLRSLLLLLALQPAVQATYTDEVGVDQALRSYIGPPFAGSALSSKSVLVATRAGALAVLNARTGETSWRAVLPSGERRKRQSVRMGERESLC